MTRLKKLQNIKGLSGFNDFLKNQGVLTLAIGFILGTAISKFVSSFVTDIINPILNALLGGVDSLNTKVFYIGDSAVHYGTFLNNGIDFIVIALVVYFGFRLFRVDQEKIGKLDVGKINTLNSAIKK